MSEDLIKRADAIEGLARLEPYVVNVYGAALLMYSNKELQTMLRAIPSADRPQGTYTNTTTYEYWVGFVTKCENCGTEWMSEYENYCPNCGAKMKGVDDDSKRD